MYITGQDADTAIVTSRPTRKPYQGSTSECWASSCGTACPRTAIRYAASCDGAGVRCCIRRREIDDWTTGDRIRSSTWSDASADVDVGVNTIGSSRGCTIAAASSLSCGTAPLAFPSAAYRIRRALYPISALNTVTNRTTST